jgi:hypothetical protein
MTGYSYPVRTVSSSKRLPSSAGTRERSEQERQRSAARAIRDIKTVYANFARALVAILDSVPEDAQTLAAAQFCDTFAATFFKALREAPGGERASLSPTAEAICVKLRWGASRPEAAKSCGVARSVFSRWLRSDPDFARAVRWAELAGATARQHAPNSNVDPARKAHICVLLRDGMSRRAAAATVGVSHQTFYNWLQVDPGFLAAVRDATVAAMTARHAPNSA